jgi:hypothetical protein
VTALLLLLRCSCCSVGCCSLLPLLLMLLRAAGLQRRDARRASLGCSVGLLDGALLGA